MLDVKGLLGTMGVNTEKQMDLPEGGTGSGGGFVAPVWGGLHYAFSAEINLAEHNADLPKDDAIDPKFVIDFGDSGWVKMYWEGTPEGFAAAEKARKDLGIDYRTGLVWYAMCEVDSVLNLSDEKKAKFVRPEISAESRVMTFGSKKYRHEWQLITLPMAVSAIAQLYRKELEIDDDVDLSFDISDLRRLEAEVTDAQYEQLCGNPDERNGYKTSILFERRAKLWEALGESDATKYMPTGTGKHATDAPALNLCLSFMTSEWSAPVWARFSWIPDPRPDSKREKDDATYRNQLPGLLKLYRTEQEARADIVTDDSASTATVTNEPPLPAEWADMRDEWMQELQMHNGKPAVLAAKKTDASVDDVVAWRTFLNIGDD